MDHKRKHLTYHHRPAAQVHHRMLLPTNLAKPIAALTKIPILPFTFQKQPLPGTFMSSPEFFLGGWSRPLPRKALLIGHKTQPSHFTDELAIYSCMYNTTVRFMVLAKKVHLTGCTLTHDFQSNTFFIRKLKSRLFWQRASFKVEFQFANPNYWQEWAAKKSAGILASERGKHWPPLNTLLSKPAELYFFLFFAQALGGKIVF